MTDKPLTMSCRFCGRPPLRPEPIPDLDAAIVAKIRAAVTCNEVGNTYIDVRVNLTDEEADYLSGHASTKP